MKLSQKFNFDINYNNLFVNKIRLMGNKQLKNCECIQRQQQNSGLELPERIMNKMYFKLIQEGIIDERSFLQIKTVPSIPKGILQFDSNLSGKYCILIEEKKIIYCGIIKEGLCNDKGAVIIFSDNSWYQGSVINGQVEGNGKWESLSEGISYFGEFKKGKQNGKGVEKAPGACYTGQFLDGKKQGNGILQLDDKNKYIGQFKENQIDGFGTYTTDKSKTTGHWVRGQLNGEAKQQYKDGSCFQGYFKNGQKCGKGIYYWIDGTKYEGLFNMDLINGEGILNTQGHKFKGNWKNGAEMSLNQSVNQSIMDNISDFSNRRKPESVQSYNPDKIGQSIENV